MPTPVDTALRALEWSAVGAGDVFYELGCGDGRVSIEAARRGARAVCVELDAAQAAQAEHDVKRNGLAGHVRVLKTDLYQVDLSEATVVYLFLLPAMNSRLVPQLNQLRPGTRVISREFEIPGWPCGHRLKLPGGLLLRWVLPVRCSSTPTGGRTEDEIEDHLLECAAEDATASESTVHSDPRSPQSPSGGPSYQKTELRDSI